MTTLPPEHRTVVQPGLLFGMLPPSMLGALLLIAAAIILRALGDAVPWVLRDIAIALAFGAGGGAVERLIRHRERQRRQRKGQPPGGNPKWRFFLILVAVLVLLEAFAEDLGVQLPRWVRIFVTVLAFLATIVVL